MTTQDAIKTLNGAGLGKGAGGGSDLAFRYVKSLEVLPIKGAVSLSDVADVLDTVSNAKALGWATTYLSGLEKNAGNRRRGAAFAQFIAHGGYGKLAEALRAIIAGQWFTLSESIAYPDGTSARYGLDVPREVQNKFGIRLTDSRRNRWGKVSAAAPVALPYGLETAAA